MLVLLVASTPVALPAVMSVTLALGALASKAEENGFGSNVFGFTAGIGEKAASIRAGVCKGLAWLGLELDQKANAANGPLISTKASKVRAWVIPTNEEIMIARHTLMLVDRKR